MQGFALDAASLALLRGVVRTILNESRAQRSNPDEGLAHQDYMTPEVYVAKTPEGGIPGLVEATGTTGDPDIPGSAFCRIYVVDRDTSYNVTGLKAIDDDTREVFNLSTTAIAGDTWVLATRAKAGEFVATVANASAEVDVDCSLVLNEDGSIGINFDEVTGPGLEVIAATEEDCKKFGVKTGCHIKLDNGDAVAFDATAFLATSSGLEFVTEEPSTCPKLKLNFTAATTIIFGDFTYGLSLIDIGGGNFAVGVNVGCGIIRGVGGAVTFDNSTVAGVAALTGLTPLGPCGLGVDLAIASTDDLIERISDVSVTDCCTVTRTITERTWTFHKNAAGDVIGYVKGVPVETVTTYDKCLEIKCCLAGALVAEGVADLNHGLAPLEVNFSATVTGGVGPYTYLWEFIDGGATSDDQNPTHTFNAVGLYVVKLTVTDACNCTQIVFVPVAVGDECECDACLVTGAPDGSIIFTLEDGTDQFAGANGNWEVFPIGGCQFGWYQNGFTANVSVGSPNWSLTVTAAGGVMAEYSSVDATCCVGPTTEALDTSTGTGAPPTVVDGILTGGGGCDPCPFDGCCEGNLPSVITATVSATGGCAAANGMVVTMTQSSPDQWDYSGVTGGSIGCQQITLFQYNCSTHTLAVAFGTDNGGSSASPTTFTCESSFGATFVINLTFVTDETCCTGTITVVLS